MPPRHPRLAPLPPPRLPHSSSSTTRLLPRSFTTSRTRCAAPDALLPDHYAALELPPSATAADIKRQFYTLSKRHHPDTLRRQSSPADPSPSPARFHAINDAYHTLSDPTARSRYDRDFARAYGHPLPSPSSSSSYAPPGGGTYTSHAGSRPASGLSRRRAQFRGPPPSFYAHGGWGRQGTKRAASAAGADGSASPSSGEGRRAEGGEGVKGESEWGGGFGPGQAPPSGWDEGLPHFDRAAHRRTQEGVQEIIARRRRRRDGEAAEDVILPETGTFGSFLLVSGVVGIVIAVPFVLFGRGSDSGTPKREREGKG